MDPWQLILVGLGGGVIGGVAVKLLDIFLLQPQLRRSERARWLRETKIEAYSNLVGDMWRAIQTDDETPQPTNWEYVGRNSKTLFLFQHRSLFYNVVEYFANADKLRRDYTDWKNEFAQIDIEEGFDEEYATEKTSALEKRYTELSRYAHFLQNKMADSLESENVSFDTSDGTQEQLLPITDSTD